MSAFSAPAQLSKIFMTSAPDLICIIKYSIVASVSNFMISSNSSLFSIKNFFANKINVKVLDELGKILLINNAVTREQNGLLKDKSFLVTGKLDGISRAEVKSLIEENSGITVSTVSKKLDYLIIGEKPTKRKVESAKELKIKIISQNDFLKMLNKTS